MKLFENKVGRPSNETLRKRRTVYFLVTIAIIAFAGIGAFYVSNIFNNNLIVSKEKNVSTKLYGDVASDIAKKTDAKVKDIQKKADDIVSDVQEKSEEIMSKIQDMLGKKEENAEA